MEIWLVIVSLVQGVGNSIRIFPAENDLVPRCKIVSQKRVMK